MNKLTFLATSLPRNNLDKDIRLIQFETFYHNLFGREAKGKNGTLLKIELGKLHAASREIIAIGQEFSGMHSSNVSILKGITYEKMN